MAHKDSKLYRHTSPAEAGRQPLEMPGTFQLLLPEPSGQDEDGDEDQEEGEATHQVSCLFRPQMTQAMPDPTSPPLAVGIQKQGGELSRGSVLKVWAEDLSGPDDVDFSNLAFDARIARINALKESTYTMPRGSSQPKMMPMSLLCLVRATKGRKEESRLKHMT